MVNNPIRLPSKNYYLLLMEDLIAVAKETKLFTLSEKEWNIFENFMDEVIEKGFEAIPLDKKEVWLEGHGWSWGGNCPNCRED